MGKNKNPENIKKTNVSGGISMVGVRRFELPTSWSRTKRANRAALHPDRCLNTLPSIKGECQISFQNFARSKRLKGGRHVPRVAYRFNQMTRLLRSSVRLCFGVGFVQHFRVITEIRAIVCVRIQRGRLGVFPLKSL